MAVTEFSSLSASGEALDMSPDAFGELLDSSGIAFDAVALRERMARDGYLFLPGLLDRAEVLEARRIVAERLQQKELLRADSDPMECLAAEGVHGAFDPGLAINNEPLMRVLYEGPMMAFWARLFGEEVRHFDFTWFRAVAPGHATPPHTDAVYMNRGTLELYTAWTPIGDVPREQGTLMVLENSHRHEKLRNVHSAKDVDAFCTNKAGREHRGFGGGTVRKGGSLSHRPATLRKSMGGRWLTSDFQAGDVLVFSIFTVHASLDNGSDRIRLSSDSRYQRASEPADERWIGPNPVGHGPGGKRGMIC